MRRLMRLVPAARAVASEGRLQEMSTGHDAECTSSSLSIKQMFGEVQKKLGKKVEISGKVK